MADTEQEFDHGFIDVRRNNKGQELGRTDVGTSFAAASTFGNLHGSVGALRAQLATSNAAFYTAARLNQMTKNDMVYAIRQIGDAAGIR